MNSVVRAISKISYSNFLKNYMTVSFDLAWKRWTTVYMVVAAPEPSVGLSVVIVEAGAVASVVAGSSPEPSVVA